MGTWSSYDACQRKIGCSYDKVSDAIPNLDNVLQRAEELGAVDGRISVKSNFMFFHGARKVPEEHTLKKKF